MATLSWRSSSKSTAEGWLVLERFHAILDDLWNVGEAPQNWPKAVIMALYKKAHRSTCNCWRGISLLFHGIKVILKIDTNRLKYYCEAQNIPPGKQ